MFYHADRFIKLQKLIRVFLLSYVKTRFICKKDPGQTVLYVVLITEYVATSTKGPFFSNYC